MCVFGSAPRIPPAPSPPPPMQSDVRDPSATMAASRERRRASRRAGRQSTILGGAEAASPTGQVKNLLGS